MRHVHSISDDTVPLRRRLHLALGLGAPAETAEDVVARVAQLEHGARVAAPVLVLAAVALSAFAWDAVTAVPLGVWWTSIVGILGVRYGLLRPVRATSRSPDAARRIARAIATGAALTGAMMGGLGALAIGVPSPEVHGLAFAMVALVCGLSPFGLHPVPAAWLNFNATMVGLFAFAVALEYPAHTATVACAAGFALAVGWCAMRALHVDLRVRIAQARRIDGLVGTLRDRSHRDPLTGLRNRQWLGEHLSNLSDLDGVALAFVDLDGFKALNDAHGHAAGDVVLRAYAAALQGAVRGIDHVVRLGGDEFVVVMGAVASQRAAEAAAERIVAAARVPVALPDGTSVVPDASHGVSMLAGGGADRALQAADAAMYAAKRRRRGDGA
jgi:diguanylate cyclase (GGDEF)-like protein